MSGSTSRRRPLNLDALSDEVEQRLGDLLNAEYTLEGEVNGTHDINLRDGLTEEERLFMTRDCLVLTQYVQADLLSFYGDGTSDTEFKVKRSREERLEAIMRCTEMDDDIVKYFSLEETLLKIRDVLDEITKERSRRESSTQETMLDQSSKDAGYRPTERGVSDSLGSLGLDEDGWRAASVAIPSCSAQESGEREGSVRAEDQRADGIGGDSAESLGTGGSTFGLSTRGLAFSAAATLLIAAGMGYWLGTEDAMTDDEV